MLRRLLAAGAFGSLAGCVVGPGYGYYDQGYAAAPVYGAMPAYGYAPAYGYGQVDIAVTGRRDARDYHDGSPRADWHGSRDDRGGRPAPSRGYGSQHPQPGQPAATMNDGRGANPAAGGGAGQQGRQGGGSRQDAGGSSGRSTWQGNGNSRWQ